MNTNKLMKFVKCIDILLMIATGAIFLIFALDIYNYMSCPQDYYQLIGKGSIHGCNYVSSKNYIIFAIVSTISVGVAFFLGFLFKDKRWSVSFRGLMILMTYVLNYILEKAYC